MATKVETLRVGTLSLHGLPGFVTKFAAVARRWAQRGQLGNPDRLGTAAEMRSYTGAR